MSNRRWVTAHGKTFEVETIETPGVTARKTRKTKQEKEFAIVPLKWAATIAKETEAQRTLVWIVLLYLSFKARSKTFLVSNATMARYGISHDTKTRALKDLEAIGRVVVRQRKGSAPVVTLIGFPDPR
jgi:hypothetical protein